MQLKSQYWQKFGAQKNIYAYVKYLVSEKDFIMQNVFFVTAEKWGEGVPFSEEIAFLLALVSSYISSISRDLP